MFLTLKDVFPLKKICFCYLLSTQKESQIFPPTTGGAEKMAADMEVPFLGKLPLDPRIGRCCDEGKSFLSEVPESPAANAYKQIIQSTFLISVDNLLKAAKYQIQKPSTCRATLFHCIVWLMFGVFHLA